jgi:hypothetical protein
MNSKKLCVLLMTCFILSYYTSVSGQSLNSGIAGNKNVFFFSGSGGIRGLALAAGGAYKFVYNSKNDEMVRRANLLRWESSLQYTRILKRGFGLGLVVHYSHVTPGQRHLENMSFDYLSEFGYWTSTTIKSTSPTFSSLGARLALTFASRSSFLPIGYSHTIAVGPRQFVMNTSAVPRMAARVEAGQLNNFSYYPDHTAIPQPSIIDPPPSEFNNSYWGVDFCYSSRVSYPITKFFMIDFGFDLRFGTVFSNRSARLKNDKLYGNTMALEDELNKAYWNRDFQRSLMFESMTNIFNLRVGFALCF